MVDEHPDRLLSADGRSWFGFAPDGADLEGGESREPPAEGSLIRLMGEDTVELPLWSDGLLFDEPAELMRELGVSEGLATDIAAWGIAWQTQSGQAEHDLEAVRLVRRLSDELAKYTFVYHP